MDPYGNGTMHLITTINQTKFSPVSGPEIARATASAIWAQNRRDFQTNPSNGPSNVKAPHKILDQYGKGIRIQQQHMARRMGLTGSGY